MATDVVVIGDGPGGLSAALYLAKAGKQVVVYGQDKTAMHAALLKNYLGIQEMTGTEFQQIARAQVEQFGARIVDDHVTGISHQGDTFQVSLESGEQTQTTYLILSEGKSPRLAQTLGIEWDEVNGVSTDVHGKTSVDRVYAVGRQVRPGRSQAIISAGDGAAAAIDILSREQGEPVTDWDTPD
jgi:thioredoxin reductase (NADPH)